MLLFIFISIIFQVPGLTQNIQGSFLFRGLAASFIEEEGIGVLLLIEVGLFGFLYVTSVLLSQKRTQ